MCAFDVICSHWPVTCDSADRPERCFILEDGWQVLSPRLYFLRYHYQSVVPKEDPRNPYALRDGAVDHCQNYVIQTKNASRVINPCPCSTRDVGPSAVVRVEGAGIYYWKDLVVDVYCLRLLRVIRKPVPFIPHISPQKSNPNPEHARI
ncbi:uncharacterized protein BO96DRAFT_440187 [Aspergillus niger CBS 101883]|uniref:Contig An08c0280, genomic contig n=3 Tax=Aspergillus niger TaxID=5061 RepID=A2QSK7_ASPNC|nr:uncharacterized protein BO96DRAFT_440187 [Aspergillus niger CBS 101883]XP_059604194.1 uncharacterized protein An08g11080 [Aspergillus niger]PYH50141.1 hypothetical protein BO96DRAFT_440187 [Aspergillus niger CBS 101883]RDH16245.1 hypothetical protein M747DRAFT_245501 [Aspergillus niger ATCC 13496]CAK45779.1 unnamed protein product [Aspergillus niger]